MALLVAGAAVGAGILGLPVQTGLAGFWPAVGALTLMWLVLLVSALVIADAYLRHGRAEADLAGLYHRELGPAGKWAAVGAYFVNYYGIMVAYLSGAAAVLGLLTGRSDLHGLLILFFFLVATGACLAGPVVVRRFNALLMLPLVASLVWLLWLALGEVQPARLAYRDWSYLPATLPVITCSLVFHNLVPLVCRELGGGRGAILRALGWGSLAPWLLGVLCLLVTVGGLPLRGGEESLWAAFQKDQPATVALARALHSPQIVAAGLVFSLCAILTSYLAVGTTLMRFWGDLAPPLARRGTWARALITFAPPLGVVFLWPDLFLAALNLVGGVGLGVLVGLAPAMILLRRGCAHWRLPRRLGWLLLALFAAVMVLELSQEIGLFHISPQVEHWTSYQPPR
jgi:tyrosine-specific transport protein